MVRTPSTMLPLGTEAPEFELPDVVRGVNVRLDQFREAPALVVMFICNHCPYVVHLAGELAVFGYDMAAKRVAVVAISSNDPGAYPADSPDKMRAEAISRGYPFPYLFDESQDVAKAYRAACTPDFYLFDGSRRLVYRGQFDASRPGNGVLVTGADLRFAVDAVLAGRPVDAEQVPSIGCNIKWRPGAAPSYFGR